MVAQALLPLTGPPSGETALGGRALGSQAT